MRSIRERTGARPVTVRLRALLAVLCAVALLGAPALVSGAGASTPPGGPPPDQSVRQCQFEWCQRLIERFCHRIDCAELSKLFRGTASSRSSVARRVLRDHGDPAFSRNWKGNCFEAHHIVAQSDVYGGAARFAQALLHRVGIKADDFDNLAGLRGPDCQQGASGYGQLANYPKLRRRMAHSDTKYRYYYETVNERFAQWIRSHGGHLPNEAQVRAILREIKKELYAGGKAYIKPGVKPRAVDAGTT